MSINPQLEELERVRQRAKPPLDRLRLTAYLLIGVGVLAFWVLAVYGLIALLQAFNEWPAAPDDARSDNAGHPRRGPSGAENEDGRLAVVIGRRAVLKAPTCPYLTHCAPSDAVPQPTAKAIAARSQYAGEHETLAYNEELLAQRPLHSRGQGAPEGMQLAVTSTGGPR